MSQLRTLYHLMRAQWLLRASLLLLVTAGCAAQPSALPTATSPVVTTRVPALATPDITQSPSPPVSDSTAGWETFTSSRGYRLKYPPELLLEKRQDGMYVLLQDKNPSSFVFSMDERGLVTLAAMRDKATVNFVNPAFTEIQMPGARGFVVEGKLGPGYGEGEYAKSAYIELNDTTIAFGCNLSLCTSELYDQILATLETNP